MTIFKSVKHYLGYIIILPWRARKKLAEKERKIQELEEKIIKHIEIENLLKKNLQDTKNTPVVPSTLERNKAMLPYEITPWQAQGVLDEKERKIQELEEKIIAIQDRYSQLQIMQNLTLSPIVQPTLAKDNGMLANAGHQGRKRKRF